MNEVTTSAEEIIAFRLPTILDIGQGNPGALTVTQRGIESFGEAFLDALIRSGLEGPDVWVRFKDECGEDLAAMFKSLQEVPA